MYLYKDGMVCYADKDQIELFLADGWSKEAPAEVVDEEVIVDEEIVDEEVVDDEVVTDETAEPSTPTGRKINRKKA